MITSHIHMILGSDGTNDLVGKIRDFKSYTSRSIRKLLEDTTAVSESRREWMYWTMKHAGAKNSNTNDFQFWIQDSHPIVLDSVEIMEQMLHYIHQNPVVSGLCQNYHWLFSIAIDYMTDQKGLVDVILMDRAKAVNATARKIGLIIWTMVTKKIAYKAPTEYLFIDQKRKQKVIYWRPSNIH